MRLQRAFRCGFSLAFTLCLLGFSAAAQTNPPSLESQAAKAYREGDYGDAANLYQQMVKANPRNAQAWYSLGESLQQNGDKNGAAQAYNTALSIAGPDSDVGRDAQAKLHPGSAPRPRADALRNNCHPPGFAPAIPDGSTATAAQMATARAAVQTYVNALQTYQDCEEALIRTAPKDTPVAEMESWRDAGNAAIDQAQSLAANYTAQSKIFKARQAK